MLVDPVLHSGNPEKGFLMFMRGEKGCEIESMHRIYHYNIFIPFVKKTRNKFNGWTEGDLIPLNLMAFSWGDGEISQIENIVSKESLQIYRDGMITANKQNPQRTGTEQPADLTKTFPVTKKLQKTNTLADVPTERHLVNIGC